MAPGPYPGHYDGSKAGRRSHTPTHAPQWQPHEQVGGAAYAPHAERSSDGMEVCYVPPAQWRPSDARTGIAPRASDGQVFDPRPDREPSRKPPSGKRHVASTRSFDPYPVSYTHLTLPTKRIV